MAGYSRRCSDEELQKALSDIDNLVARQGPVPDELKSFPGDDDDKEEERKKDDEKEEKKTYVLPPKYVQMMLSYEGEEFPNNESLDELAKERGGEYQELKTAVSSLEVLGRHLQDGIRAAQEMMRQQLLTQGYVTYEATEEQAQRLIKGCAIFEPEGEAVAQQGARGAGAGGRRRQRPGVAKTAGGRVRKIN